MVGTAEPRVINLKVLSLSTPGHVLHHHSLLHTSMLGVTVVCQKRYFCMVIRLRESVRLLCIEIAKYLHVKYTRRVCRTIKWLKNSQNGWDLSLAHHLNRKAFNLSDPRLWNGVCGTDLTLCKVAWLITDAPAALLVKNVAEGAEVFSRLL